MRLIIQGLLATCLYTSYRYYTGTATTALDHTTGSLTTSTALSDGRVPISRRTVAVADLHGDLPHAINVLSMASLVSPTQSSSASHPYTWIGGHDQLVSTGDIVDRGDDTIALYRLFQSLRNQSALVGGEVKQCLGNHEVMNALGDWRYVTRGDVDSFGGPQARRKAMSVDGWIGQDWLKGYNVTQTVSLLPANHPRLPSGYTPPKVSFVHGGITPEYAERGVDYINKIGHGFLLKALSALNSNHTTEEEALWSSDGPLWYRGYATDSNNMACQNAEKASKTLGVRHLVMGHTPHMDGFVTRCDNKVLLIDTGISRAYGGEQSALVIDFDLVPTKGERDGRKRWVEKETLTALYRGRRAKVLASTETELWL
ncbi:Phosphoesterase domain protein [Kalmanozyma brasiliensis GHG001]|uniref:Calcineurin-like phosphoesterase domain-containing protein n=1 Tax=Kalmanozyma brasiliensis (strain GHG001) TaxID=1365824 RepID=V5GFZ0_KALBG|nr:Phosphoesterase domain protein [Kalmanozyma brasiliensis GHG001]EST04942.1 Phosphoesterase domain protein [Kalmanozyma brasiliensis GHG001]